jgi:hypothetical protein
MIPQCPATLHFMYCLNNLLRYSDPTGYIVYNPWTDEERNRRRDEETKRRRDEETKGRRYNTGTLESGF